MTTGLTPEQHKLCLIDCGKRLKLLTEQKAPDILLAAEFALIERHIRGCIDDDLIATARHQSENMGALSYCDRIPKGKG